MTSLRPATQELVDGVITKYVEYMTLRNLRALTIYSRQRALIRLSWWADGVPILYLSDEQLRQWREGRSKTVGPVMIRSEISHLKQFYKWAQAERYRVDDPTVRLIIPRVVFGLRRPIRDQDPMFAITTATDREVRVILGLAAFAGLRAHEIAQLDWVSIDLAADEPPDPGRGR